MVICLGRGPDLCMNQLMPLPLTVCCSSESRLVLPFWYWLTQVVLGKGPLNGCCYTSAHGSGRRYSVLLLKSLSFSFFSFAKGSPRWRYWQATFLAQKVGYRCNFKNWVQNLGGDPPLKFGGPQNPQCCDPKSEDVAQTYSKNRPWERVSKTGFKILGAPPKKIWGGQSLEISILKLALLRGHGSHSLQIFTSGSGSWCLAYVPLVGGLPPPKKKIGGGEIFSQPLRVRGRGPKFFWQ